MASQLCWLKRMLESSTLGNCHAVVSLSGEMALSPAEKGFLVLEYMLTEIHKRKLKSFGKFLFIVE